MLIVVFVCCAYVLFSRLCYARLCVYVCSCMLFSFREETMLADGSEASHEHAVGMMIEFAGHVVLLSGLTLMMTFLVLVFFPVRERAGTRLCPPPRHH